MNNRRIFSTPVKFNERSIKQFIGGVQDIFSLGGKQIENVFFDVSKTTDINIIGELLVYKFLDYTVQKKCFHKPETNLNLNTKETKYVASQLRIMGFKKLVEACFTEKNSIDDGFAYQEFNGCFLSPTVLEQKSPITGVGKLNEQKINSYYSYNKDIASAILQCIGEISSNFQEHAENDTRSVIVAKGDRDHFEIACADTGAGIISTLKSAIGDKMQKAPYLILGKSIEKGVSSKLSEGHMGCGLWLVNEYVSSTQGYLSIYSERGYLVNRKGKIKCGESPYWKGTVIYVDIPLKNPDSLNSVINSIKTKEQYI